MENSEETDEFDLIEKNLNSSKEQMIKFEQNLKTIRAIHETKRKIQLLRKINKFCERFSKKTPEQLIIKIHFVLFWLAFGIQLLNDENISDIFKNKLLTN